MSFCGKNNAKISNQPCGGGNKLQGIPSTTDKRASSIRAIQKRSWGENRNVIFNINQLGGVGRYKSQFVTGAGGVNSDIGIKSSSSGAAAGGGAGGAGGGAGGGGAGGGDNNYVKQLVNDAIKTGINRFETWFQTEGIPYATLARGTPPSPYDEKMIFQFAFYSVINIDLAEGISLQIPISDNLVMDLSSSSYYDGIKPHQDLSLNAYKQNPPYVMAGSMVKRFTSIFAFNKLAAEHQKLLGINPDTIPANFFQWWAGRDVYKAIIYGNQQYQREEANGFYNRFNNIFDDYLAHTDICDNMPTKAVTFWDLHNKHKSFDECKYVEPIYTQMFSPSIYNVWDKSGKQIVNKGSSDYDAFDPSLNDPNVVASLTVTPPSNLRFATPDYLDDPLVPDRILVPFTNEWGSGTGAAWDDPINKNYWNPNANVFNNYSPKTESYYGSDASAQLKLWTPTSGEVSESRPQPPIYAQDEVFAGPKVAYGVGPLKYVRAGIKNIRDWLFDLSGGLYSSKDWFEAQSTDDIFKTGISPFFGYGSSYFYTLAEVAYQNYRAYTTNFEEFETPPTSTGKNVPPAFVAESIQLMEMFPVEEGHTYPSFVKPPWWDDQLTTGAIPVPEFSDTYNTTLYQAGLKGFITSYINQYIDYQNGQLQKNLKNLTPFGLDHMTGNFRNSNEEIPDADGDALTPPFNTLLLGKLPYGQVGMIGYLRQCFGFNLPPGVIEAYLAIGGGPNSYELKPLTSQYASNNYTFLGSLLWLLDHSDRPISSWTDLNLNLLFPPSLQGKKVYFSSTAGCPGEWMIDTSFSLSGQWTPYEIASHEGLPSGIKRPPTVNPTFPPDQYIDPSGFDIASLVMGGNITMRLEDYTECVFNTLSLDAINPILADLGDVAMAQSLYKSYIGFSMSNLNFQLRKLKSIGGAYNCGLESWYDGPIDPATEVQAQLVGHGGEGWNHSCQMIYYLKELSLRSAERVSEPYREGAGDMVVGFAENYGVGGISSRDNIVYFGNNLRYFIFDEINTKMKEFRAFKA